MNKVKLGEVLDVKRGASLSGDYYSESGEKIRLTLGNFDYPNGGFKENTSKSDIYFTGEVKPEFILKKGDIITPLTEQVAGLLGETARIPEDDLYIQSGDVGLVIPNESKLDNKYAYYLLSSPLIKRQLGAAAQQTKIRHTSPDKIKDCEAWLPSLEYQKKAGELLDFINNKIKNNNKINAELESMAKTIYDYWFLQFEFPNEEGKPYKSSGGKMVWNEELKREIPEKWETTKLLNIISIVDNRGKNPPYSENKTNHPIIDVATLRDNGRAINYNECSKYVDEKTYNEWFRAGHPKKGDILFSTVGSLAETKIFYPDDKVKGSIAQNVIGLRTDKNLYSYIYEILVSEKQNIIGYQIGSVQPSLKVGHVLEHKIILPPQYILSKFASIIECINEKVNLCVKENQELASLRDFLLPMLMNGQVGFKDGEK